MLKKLILVFSLVLLAELGLLAQALPDKNAVLQPASQPESYEQRAGVKLPASFAPNSLRISVLGNATIIDEAEFRSWLSPASDGLRPDTHSSLANYFYHQTKTRHPWTSYEFNAKVGGLGVNNQILGNYLLALAEKHQQSPQDAELVIENDQAIKFTPHREGIVLNLAQSQKEIARSILNGRESLDLPAQVTAPKRKLADLNNLGIKEFLVRGQTDFTGSSNSRIQNVRVGAARYNGLIIKPGEEFSFNKHLGPIDAAHGFLPELVIKPEGTVPEFGGGLCQVSSTAFRAAFFAGLPITQRRNHSYAVRYYEWLADDKPRSAGLDATIYPGAQDMKFINDTPGAILVWTKIEGKRLFFDFYGTKDDRKILVDGPHEYDRKPDGSVKAKVNRKVINNDGAKEITLNSRYVSPNLYPKTYEYPKTPVSTPPNL